jgi:hypothetical protein
MKFLSWISDLWRFSPRFRIGLILASLLSLVILLYPFQTTTVPQWNLRVVDDAGSPVRDIHVTEHWQHYPLDSDGHEELQTTNQDGFVSFGIRRFRASLGRRVLTRINPLSQGGRRDPYGAVVIWGSKAHATTVAVYQGNKMPPSEVRVERVR